MILTTSEVRGYVMQGIRNGFGRHVDGAAVFDAWLDQRDQDTVDVAAPLVARDIEATVERAGRAWFDRGQATRRDDGRWRDDTHTVLWQWEDLTETDRVAFRALVRPVVLAILLDGGQ